MQNIDACSRPDTITPMHRLALRDIGEASLIRSQALRLKRIHYKRDILDICGGCRTWRLPRSSYCGLFRLITAATRIRYIAISHPSLFTSACFTSHVIHAWLSHTRRCLDTGSRSSKQATVRLSKSTNTYHKTSHLLLPFITTLTASS